MFNKVTTSKFIYFLNVLNMFKKKKKKNELAVTPSFYLSTSITHNDISSETFYGVHIVSRPHQTKNFLITVRVYWHFENRILTTVGEKMSKKITISIPALFNICKHFKVFIFYPYDL